MARITWLGEDGDGVAGPSYTTCFDLKFPKGQPVEVSDSDIIKRARKNRFFEVSGVVGRPPKVTAVNNLSALADDDQDQG
jgi:hypothetical protein